MNIIPKNVLAGSCFTSIQAFQDYFREHDALFIPPNQPLEVRNISVLTNLDKNLFDVAPDEATQLIFQILNKIALPLAKTITFQFDAPGRINYHIANNIFLRCSAGMAVIAQKEAIYTHLSELFKTMIAFSISKVEFAPNQELVILGRTEKEYELESSIQKNIEKVFNRRVPLGFTLNLSFGSEDTNCTVSSGWTTYGSAAGQRCFTIRAHHGMTLSLTEPPTFLFSIEGFRSYMKMKGKMEILPNQILRIHDKALLDLEKEYPHVFPPIRSYVKFVLNQIVVPLGKTMRIDACGIAGVDAKWDEDWIEIVSKDGFTLMTEFGDIYTSLTDLGQFAYHRSSFNLQPKQRLIIYGIDKAEKSQIDQWIRSTQRKEVKSGLTHFFMRRNPMGFVWNLTWEKDLYKGLLFKEGEERYALLMSSSEEMKLSLKRVSGEGSFNGRRSPNE